MSKKELTEEQEITDIVAEKRDYITLSMEELIERINVLSKNDPFSVSKEIEEIKSVFYQKLNLEKEKEKNPEESEVQLENKLHPLEIKFKSSFNTYRKIKSRFRRKKEEEEEKNLKIKNQIIKDIDSLSKEEESIRITFEKFRVLQQRWKDTGYVPIKDNNHLWQTYHHHVELFYDFIKLNNDLRDLDFKRNLEEKKDICNKAKALLEKKSINQAHANLQELHEHWKNIGPVEKKEREKIWEEFQLITKKINKKRNDHFLKLKKQDSKKLQEKNNICKKITDLYSTELLSHKEWQLATITCIELEKEWKSLARLSKENNKIAWKELRSTLSNFYHEKNIFYKKNKQDQRINLEKRIAICIEAETLKDNTDWKETGKKLIKLQEEWKNTKFTRSSQSNEIWERFRNACNTFFESRKKHYKELEKLEEESYIKKESILKEIEEFKTSKEAEEDIKKLQNFNSRWKEIGPVPRKKMDINKRFLNLLNTKFKTLGLSKKVLEAEHYKNKISSLKGNEKALNNEKDYIKKKIEIRNKEINQYENNISFFGRGKGTESLLKEVKGQIEIAKSDIENLKKKIELLNKK